MSFCGVLTQLSEILNPDEWIPIRAVCHTLYDTISSSEFVLLLRSLYTPNRPSTSFWKLVFWYRTLTSASKEYTIRVTQKCVPEWYMQQLRSDEVVPMQVVSEGSVLTIDHIREMSEAATLDLAILACTFWPNSPDFDLKIAGIKQSIDVLATVLRTGFMTIVSEILFGRLRVGDIVSAQYLFDTYQGSNIYIGSLRGTTKEAIEWLKVGIFKNYKYLLDYHSDNPELVRIIVTEFGLTDHVNWREYLESAANNLDYDALVFAKPYVNNVKYDRILPYLETYASVHIIKLVLDIQLTLTEFLDVVSENDVSKNIAEHIIRFHFRDRLDWNLIAKDLLSSERLDPKVVATVVMLDLEYNPIEEVRARWYKK